MRLRRWLEVVSLLLMLSTVGRTAADGGGAPGEPTGGPGGDFDWVIPSGEMLFLSTDLNLIIGGPGGVPVTVQEVVGGVVQVRDLIIEEGAVLRAFGPHPLRILASRDVVVRGTIDVSGFDAKDVLTLNTGHQPEVGGSGGPGGGNGGTASYVTNQSTPVGGTGFGPAGLPDAGGMGGESAYAPTVLDHRRPGGGGGGRFAADEGSLVAGWGTHGHPLSLGALTSQAPASGGRPGNGPFLDASSVNDYWGLGPESSGAGPRRLVRGELAGLCAGSGGGAGGDAIPSSEFPPAAWTPAHDEKGGGGGGGGGGLHVLALGPIVFGAQGRILADGGGGATGEHVLFPDHVGGSGGSGSGGHVVLETRTHVDFSDGGTNVGASTFVSAVGGPQITGTPLPPPDVSFGGPGGPGVIQLHVPNPFSAPSAAPAASIVLPSGVASVEQLTAPNARLLLPFRDRPQDTLREASRADATPPS